jgi:uncharacterized protein YbaP (TraB family)
MNIRRSALVLPLILTVLAAPLIAKGSTPTDKPFLWMIATDPPSFLYGTIHLPDDRVLALPEVVDAAFEACDIVVTELHLDTKTQMSIAIGFMLPEEETLATLLPEDLYERTDAYFQSRGFSLDMFQKFKIYAVAVQLVLLDYLPEMMTKKPLDVMLYERAAAEDKEADALETVEEQLAIFESFSVDEQIQWLRDTLDYLEENEAAGESVMERLVVAYLGGDGEKFWEIMNEYQDPNDAFYEKFMRIALSDRNVRMVEGIVERLKAGSGKSYFFAVGAAHYHRDDGIIALMREAGYEVTRLTPKDAKRLREGVTVGE